ncbi:MAG TPA: TolC family protein [Terriglobales bacterium]|nr:TolC family protein [Terriglobales bacterium]
MKTTLGLVQMFVCCFSVVCLFFAATNSASAEILTLKRAVQLAVAHSPASEQAAADEQRAFASYREAKNAYLPQVMVGSGLGDTWGYPLSLEGSAPSLFNVTAQSPLFNPALHDFIQAARSENRAMAEENKDRKNQVTQDTVLTYLELLKWQKQIAPLRQQYEDALKTQELVDQRVKAGVDSEQAGKQSQLVAARAYLRITQAQGAIDLLRASLSQLTGVPENSLQTDPDSVPSLPEMQPKNDDIERAEQTNPAVLFAQQHAIAETFRARAEHRSSWPTADFAAQYALLAKFNNWAQFFQPRAFEQNNASVGVVLRFPFLNFSQHAHAEVADADAIRAKKDVESTKNQVSQQTLKLQHSIEQLQAAQKVSELEYEIAQSNVDAVQIRVNSGTATIENGAQARAELSEKYNALQDADFELLRARIGLLRGTGELQSWVDQGK